MASIDKLKGRYLFGGSEAASVVPQAGSGSLTVTTGPGGFTYGANYVDCKQGSYFRTPFNTDPRNRTIIIVGANPAFESVYDDDLVFRFPPTVARAKAMSKNGVLWTDTTGLSTWIGENVTGSPTFSAGSAGYPVLTYTDKDHDMIAYRDGTFTFMPQIWIGSQPPSPPIEFGHMMGRNLGWHYGSSDPYAAVGAADPKSQIGSCLAGGAAQTQAGSHHILLGFAEYEYLTKAEALEAATEMVVLLEARGWTGLFHNPVTAEPTVAPPVVVTLSPTSTISLAVGTAFSRTFSGGGGTSPYVIAQDGGTLPAGLSLSSGVLSGTPTTEGAFSFGIKATDANGVSSATTTFSGTVAASGGGSNIVTDPGFDGTGSYWTTDPGVTVSGGKCVFAQSSASAAYHIGGFSTGVSYVVTYTVDSVSGGTGIVVTLGGQKGTPRSAPGTYTETIVSAGSYISFMNDSGLINAQIDNVSAVLA